MKRVRRALFWIVGLAIVAVIISPVITGGHYSKNGEEGGEGGGSRHGRGGKAGEGGPPVPVLTATVKSSGVPVYIEGVGTGKARQSVLIRSQADGTLLSLNFIEGQDVKAGDLIAEIDPRLYQATLDQNIAKKASDEAALANAKLDLVRYTNLFATKAATQQQLDTQKATVAQDEAQVKLDQAMIDSARTSLSYCHITTPISGRTGIRVTDAGNLIHATDTAGLVTVSQIQPLDVLFTVPQQQLVRIIKASSGGTLQVEAVDNDGTRVIDQGKLDVVDNTIDQTTGTVKLRAVFPNAKLELWPGTFTNVRLLVETLQNAVTVPVAAVQRGPKGAFVFIATDGKAAMRPVTLGQQDDKQAVVTAGVSAGDVVVTTGFSKLADGSRIAMSDDTSAAPPGTAPALHQQGVAPPAGSDTPHHHWNGQRSGDGSHKPPGATQ